MRVMMLSWEYPPRIVGGISPHVHELSQQLAKKGVEVHVITMTTPGAPDDEVEASGVHVHRVRLPGMSNDFLHEMQLLNQATVIRARQLMEDWRPGGQPTIFHAHDWLSFDSGRELKYEFNLPLLGTIHATEAGRNGGIFTDTQRYIYQQEFWLTFEAWRTIVCSEFMKGEVMRQFNLPAEKIDVIFNGVDATKFEFEWTAEERAEYRATLARPDEKIVMYVGRFVREKGIQVLLDAVSSVLSQEPNTRFLIVGGGNRDRFEDFLDWANLRDRVKFTGFMANPDLYKLFRVADVAAFPSLYEPFGIVALEGMAAGVPVVSSDAGGLPEVVLHEQTGTLSYAGDPQSLAWAILRVLQDPDRAHRLSQNATERLKTDFDWGHIADQTIAVYDRVWAEFLKSPWAEGVDWSSKSDAINPAGRSKTISPQTAKKSKKA